MCVVSMIMDHYTEKWRPRVHQAQPFVSPQPFVPPQPPAITPEEIQEFRRLLERARQYDRENNEPDCELDEKRQALKRIASELGVEIAFI